MMRQCTICGNKFEGNTRLCSICNGKLNAQNDRTGMKSRSPVYECVIEGCYEEATATTLCIRHTEMLVKDSGTLCKHPRCSQKAEIKDYCLKHFGIMKLRIEDVEPVRVVKPLKIESIAKVEYAEGTCVESLLPEFLRNNEIIAKNTDMERCNSKFGCLNSVYKEGLCRVHYNMKHGIELFESQPVALRKPAVPLPKYIEPTSVVKCKNTGCGRPATHAGVCYSCYNSKHVDSDMRIKEKIMRLRNGH